MNEYKAPLDYTEIVYTMSSLVIAMDIQRQADLPEVNVTLDPEAVAWAKRWAYENGVITCAPKESN